MVRREYTDGQTRAHRWSDTRFAEFESCAVRLRGCLHSASSAVDIVAPPALNLSMWWFNTTSLIGHNPAASARVAPEPEPCELQCYLAIFQVVSVLSKAVAVLS